jgi:4-diphosphocytidyl-2C-methyl-D-erythritol kinase
MSGSGSTLFTLFDDSAAAKNAASEIDRRGTRSIAVQLGVIPRDDVHG